MKIWHLLATATATVTVAFFLLVGIPADASFDPIDAFRRASADASLCHEIVALARRGLEDTVLRGVTSRPFTPRHALLKRPAGVFVTLVKDGKVRGCMGALDPVEATVCADIVRAAVLAASEDTRYPPLRPSELARIEPVVSIVGPRRPVQSLGQLDPLRLGLFVEREGRGGVLLPGEALSAGWQVSECKRKAGIPPRGQVAMYVFSTVVFQERARAQRRNP